MCLSSDSELTIGTRLSDTLDHFMFLNIESRLQIEMITSDSSFRTNVVLESSELDFMYSVEKFVFI